jgi:hypothetical protein
MKKLFAAVFFMAGFFLSTYAVGQVYDNRQEVMIDPVDRIIEQHARTYANVGVVGEKDDAVPQDERYIHMTEPVDEINERHFNILQNAGTVVEGSTWAE